MIGNIGDRLEKLITKASEHAGGMLVADEAPPPADDPVIAPDRLQRLAPGVLDMHTSVGRHEENVLSMDFSPDGAYVATGSADFCVKILDASRAQRRQGAGDDGDSRRKVTLTSLYGANAPITALSFHPYAAVVATGCNSAVLPAANKVDNTIRLYQFLSNERRPITEIPVEKGVKQLAWHPRGGHLAAVIAQSPVVRLYDIKTGMAYAGKPKAGQDNDGSMAISVATHPATFAVGQSNGFVNLVDPTTMATHTAFKTSGRMVRGVQLSHDGTKLLVTSESAAKQVSRGGMHPTVVPVHIEMYDVRKLMQGEVTATPLRREHTTRGEQGHSVSDEDVNMFGDAFPIAQFGNNDKYVVYAKNDASAMSGKRRILSVLQHIAIDPSSGRVDDHVSQIPLYHTDQVAAMASSRVDPFVITGSHDNYIRFHVLEFDS
ncbi:WD domain G-beta repeat [Carpediemonas membranifera]|uniref:Cleavage stimulation factor 50 kDa subunit n=1 Tax=Carpediemonas membranifera TaxID=201153 RepID=A0A8J6B5B1_9EUKA|nr:WD domain G-beta repeat [Carpediemonas membranifera]|eukprot:KAG9393182.1 WD domain G-beta repeat [Carpediemonas membranifera]